MALKQSEVLSREDFDSALRYKRLSISEVSKETSIPRAYLSEFRQGDRRLKPEYLAKLRDYFEAKGVEFEDDDSETQAAGDGPALAGPHPRLRQIGSYCFPIPATVPQEVIAKTMDVLEDNDARLVALLRGKAERDEGLFGGGQFTDEAKAQLQEAFGLLAANYFLLRMLRGWSAVGLTPSSEFPETLRDVVFNTFRQQLEDAGLIEPESSKDTAEQDESEEAA